MGNRDALGYAAQTAEGAPMMHGSALPLSLLPLPSFICTIMSHYISAWAGWRSRKVNNIFYTYLFFYIFAFLSFAGGGGFKFPGIWKCSVGELVDVAIWKGHLVWRTLPDSGPNSGATGTWLRWQAAAWHLPRYGKSSQQYTSSAWEGYQSEQRNIKS